MLLARRRGRAGAIPSRPSASYDRLFSFEVFSQAASLSLNLGYLVHDASCLCLLHSGAFVAVRNSITIGDCGGSVVQDARAGCTFLGCHRSAHAARSANARIVPTWAPARKLPKLARVAHFMRNASCSGLAAAWAHSCWCFVHKAGRSFSPAIVICSCA